jgi:hypothetical protein
MPYNRPYLYGRDRLLTLFMYLNNVEEGGETAFPLIGDNKWLREEEGDLNICSGLKIKPKANTCVLWYNILGEEQHNATYVDNNSLHMGCDVVHGVKWAANKWVYNKDYVK